ncbi:uncharacterized protein BO80DRAFT_43686 [Aspergillus ibericus CBS 121593]|uniref:Uncharacterized protein n=1 Tax=Aspergillus ibericus CBS 121593 TaxID=1448316 RepID=A0A395H3T9_9EURO|nr:hypothetical protein BO80DRAFT_43686 [Aspergillus ibericus CBS 121593]RAL02273.1 hypothetical protein BO80DRAFT_43686 [Aspergillus ibericus CBS 121593]
MDSQLSPASAPVWSSSAKGAGRSVSWSAGEVNRLKDVARCVLDILLDNASAMSFGTDCSGPGVLGGNRRGYQRMRRQLGPESRVVGRHIGCMCIEGGVQSRRPPRVDIWFRLLVSQRSIHPRHSSQITRREIRRRIDGDRECECLSSLGSLGWSIRACPAAINKRGFNHLEPQHIMFPSVWFRGADGSPW